MGPCYMEPIRAKEETREIDEFYKMIVTLNDYINSTTDGMLSWHCARYCMSDSKEGLENSNNRLHEILGRRCARLTKSLHWIGTEV